MGALADKIASLLGLGSRPKAPAKRASGKGNSRPSNRPAAAAPVVAKPSAPTFGEDDADVTPIRAPGLPRRPAGVPSPVKAGSNLPAPVTLSGLPARAAGDKEVEELQKFNGDVVTGAEGQFKLTERQIQICAALSDGTLLIAESAKGSSPASSARALLDREGYKIKHILLVPMEVIRSVYETYHKRVGYVSSQVDIQAMQRVVLDLIRTAAQANCSDIHVDVGRHEANIRVRSDGVMTKLRELPSGIAQEMLMAAFHMADASDATYKQYDGQDARITSLKTTLPEGVQAIRLRYNPLPDGGRHCVMRLLYADRRKSAGDVDVLGYAEHHVKQIREMRSRPYGINIISGPTGSGKSTTLQTSLQSTIREKRGEVNVLTVEDPPEYEIRGAIQLPVTNATSADDRNEAFRLAITGALRSDPDILMIGEIRDAASASLAFQAAMTGHQVWASLHANNGLSVLDRLRDLNVEEYKLSDASLVTGLIGQRLVRRVCPHCGLRTRDALDRKITTEAEVELLGRIFTAEVVDNRLRFANPDGCGHCRSGYAGRSVVAETIIPDEKFMEFISRGEKVQAHQYWIDNLEGMTMLEHALLKVAAGEVDANEVRYKVGVIQSAEPDRIQHFITQEHLLLAS